MTTMLLLGKQVKTSFVFIIFANRLLLDVFDWYKRIYEVSNIGNILVIKADEGILRELLELLENKEQCRVIDLPLAVHRPNILSFPGLKIYLKEQMVYRNGNRVCLSKQEFLLLLFLAEHPRWVCTKEEIYNVVCGEKIVGDIDNIVYCLVRSLRKKLETDSRHPEYIQTVRGVGYKFVVPGE